MPARALILLAILAPILLQAAPFENLGFDLARTNTLTVSSSNPLRGVGPVEDLLPGWQLTKGGVAQPTLGLNLSLLSYGYATLIGADQSDFFQFPVHGAYALHLVGSPGNQDPFAISQRGDVPAEAPWLSFAYSGFGFSLSIDGKNIQPTWQTATWESFNLSAFSGQTVDLTLTALGPLMPTQNGASYLDTIAFNVPEPSTSAMLGCGLAILCVQLARSYGAETGPVKSRERNR